MVISAQNAAFMLLDLTAAFDTVNHSILLHLEHWGGIKGKLLQWFCSSLEDRAFSIALSKFSSSSYPIISG